MEFENDMLEARYNIYLIYAHMRDIARICKNKELESYYQTKVDEYIRPEG